MRHRYRLPQDVRAYPVRASQVTKALRQAGYSEQLERLGRIWMFTGGTSAEWPSCVVPVPYAIGDLTVDEWMAWRHELAGAAARQGKNSLIS